MCVMAVKVYNRNLTPRRETARVSIGSYQGIALAMPKQCARPFPFRG
jgi:hypothetical protein